MEEATISHICDSDNSFGKSIADRRVMASRRKVQRTSVTTMLPKIRQSRYKREEEVYVLVMASRRKVHR